MKAARLTIIYMDERSDFWRDVSIDIPCAHEHFVRVYEGGTLMTAIPVSTIRRIDVEYPPEEQFEEEDAV